MPCVVLGRRDCLAGLGHESTVTEFEQPSGVSQDKPVPTTSHDRTVECCKACDGSKWDTVLYSS